MQRRTVLRSAVKLAYATPLVVASMQLPTAKATDVHCSCVETHPCFEWDGERNCTRFLGGDGCEILPEDIPLLCPD